MEEEEEVEDGWSGSMGGCSDTLPTICVPSPFAVPAASSSSRSHPVPNGIHHTNGVRPRNSWMFWYLVSRLNIETFRPVRCFTVRSIYLSRLNDSIVVKFDLITWTCDGSKHVVKISVTRLYTKLITIKIILATPKRITRDSFPSFSLSGAYLTSQIIPIAIVSKHKIGT